MNKNIEDIISDMETKLDCIISDLEIYPEDRKDLEQLKTEVRISTEN